MKYALILLALASPVAAQEYAVRDSDTVPNTADLSTLILDRDLEYFDGGTSRYNTDGTYAWTFGANNGGQTHRGTHQIGEDAMVCIIYDTGAQRCDRFVQSAGRLVLLTDNGQRFPVRTIH